MSWTQYKPYHTLTHINTVNIEYNSQFPCSVSKCLCFYQLLLATIFRRLPLNHCVCTHIHTKRHTHTPMQRARGTHPLLLSLPLPQSPQPVIDCYRIVKTWFPCFRWGQTWGQKLGILSRIRLKLGLFSWLAFLLDFIPFASSPPSLDFPGFT